MDLRCVIGLFIVCIPAVINGLAVMSVDFGSEFMKIGIVKAGVPMEIVLNKDSQRKTRASLAFRNGERFAGDSAFGIGQRFPAQNFFYLLDLLGKKFTNPQVKLFQDRFPFYKMEEDPNTGLVVFIVDESTKYTVEELVAMLLEKAKEYAEHFGEMSIYEAVITVPPYFNQAERRAMVRAGEMAGLKVLQLINDNTAVALNYGVFRRKYFNSTATHYVFFDMGSWSSTATVVTYQEVTDKNAVTGGTEKFPQLTIRGMGFDRTLGGLSFQMKLRDYLAKAFNDQKKTKNDVTQNARAMARLLTEADRLKKALSANKDHHAVVEALLDEKDFHLKVTRAEFESLCEDLFARVKNVYDEAIKSSGIDPSEITEIILMGGSTRIPRVQDILLQASGRTELGKSINTDEAAALGAVYQAAHLGKGFKVKKFAIKEAAQYSIQAEFDRVKSGDDGSSQVSRVKRELFVRGNPYPQKKVLTFNKHTKDFDFDINYAGLEHLKEADLKVFGSDQLLRVSLEGVEEAHTKHNKEDTEPKGVKVHFNMDDSGVFSIDRAEALFERAANASGEEESAFAKISSTFSNLFSGGEKKEDDKVEEAPTNEDKPTPDPAAADAFNEPTADGKTNSAEADKQQSELPEDKKEETEGEGKDNASDEQRKEGEGEKTKEEDGNKSSAGDDKTADNKSSTDDKESKKDDKKKEEKVPKDLKPVTLKEKLKVTVTMLDVTDPTAQDAEKSKKKLDELRKLDEEKRQLEKARNDIESFAVDMTERFERDEYQRVSTAEERDELLAKLAEMSDWLSEQDDTTTKKMFEDKLKEVKKHFTGISDKVRELKERPKALEALNTVANYSEFFANGMKNLTGDDMPFTQVEFDTLNKMLTETKEWNKTMHEEQAKLKPHDMPKFLSKDIAQKAGDLDREVKYLLGKLKNFKPKKPKETTSSKKDGANDTKKEAKEDTPKFDIPPPPEEEAEKAETTKSKKMKTDNAGSEEPLELEGEVPVEVDVEPESEGGPKVKPGDDEL